MIFTSWWFLIFLLPVLVIYYWPPLRERQVSILVIASLVFYSLGQFELLPILLITVLVSFVCLQQVLKGARRALIIGIVFNLAILSFFKYKFLFIGQGWNLTGYSTIDYFFLLPLPIGISFFVFHNISMLVDFYSKKNSVGEATLKNSFLYIIFFPQLVSGPITRANAFFPQIVPKYFTDIEIVSAARWLIAGYFMKLYCANNLGQFTALMQDSHAFSLLPIDRVFLVLMYSFQIYADFFGYSAIAIGLALLFGYRLPENFRRPYLATSFSDFWTRWHISLSNWLRNYLYIPLGGNRMGGALT